MIKFIRYLYELYCIRCLYIKYLIEYGHVKLYSTAYRTSERYIYSYMFILYKYINVFGRHRGNTTTLLLYYCTCDHYYFFK